MALKRALRLRLKGTYTAAGLATLYSDFIPEGQLWCIQRLVVEGNLATSGGNTRCRVLIDGHGYKHHLAEQDAPSADTLYWIQDPFWLVPRERIAIEWDQAQANTTLEAFGTGYWVPEAEGMM